MPWDAGRVIPGQVYILPSCLKNPSYPVISLDKQAHMPILHFILKYILSRIKMTILITQKARLA